LHPHRRDRTTRSLQWQAGRVLLKIASVVKKQLKAETFCSTSNCEPEWWPWWAEGAGGNGDSCVREPGVWCECSTGKSPEIFVRGPESDFVSPDQCL
jgi:hypothetical protein